MFNFRDWYNDFTSSIKKEGLEFETICRNAGISSQTLRNWGDQTPKTIISIERLERELKQQIKLKKKGK